MLRVLLLGTLAVVLSACGAGAPAGSGTSSVQPSSGITGVARVDAGCPNVRDASPCPDKPLAAIITVLAGDGKTTVTTARTSDDGRFRIPLPPGTYVVRPANTTNSVVPVAPEAHVTVADSRFTDLTIHFDSGVR